MDVKNSSDKSVIDFGVWGATKYKLFRRLTEGTRNIKANDFIKY